MTSLQIWRASQHNTYAYQNIYYLYIPLQLWRGMSTQYREIREHIPYKLQYPHNSSNSTQQRILQQHAPPCPVLVYAVTRVSLLGFPRQRAPSCPVLLQETVNAAQQGAGGRERAQGAGSREEEDEDERRSRRGGG